MDFEEEQIKDVYAYYGLVMDLAQILEHGIVNSLVILRLPEKEKYTRQDIDEFREGSFKKTLGVLIKYLNSKATLPPELESLINKALKRRNYLTHYYFRERAEQFVTPVGRKNMLDELLKDHELFESADEELSKVMKPLRELHGITDQVYEEEYNKVCQKLGITP